MNHQSHSVTIVDHKLFASLAETLAKDFGHVNYFSTWVGGFPHSFAQMVGTGLKGVTRVNNYWEVKKDTDLFIFPDLYFAAEQEELESQGYRVWGARYAEDLEIYRGWGKKKLEKLGFPMGKYEIVKGLDALRKYLKDHPKTWVKISGDSRGGLFPSARGDMETFFSESYDIIEGSGRLVRLEVELGPKKTWAEFVCEAHIPDAVEICYDGPVVDGEYPEHAMCGIEEKGEAYLGHFHPYRDMPEQIIKTNEMLSGTYRKDHTRQMAGVELRVVKGGKYYPLDPLMRFGSPPSEAMLLEFTNLSDFLWYGAEGKCIDLEGKGEWVAQIRMESGWAEENPLAIYIPEKIRYHIKLRSYCKQDGIYYYLPSMGEKLTIFGDAVATGKTPEEAIEACKGFAEQVKGYRVEPYSDSLDKCLENMKRLKTFGVTL